MNRIVLLGVLGVAVIVAALALNYAINQDEPATVPAPAPQAAAPADTAAPGSAPVAGLSADGATPGDGGSDADVAAPTDAPLTAEPEAVRQQQMIQRAVDRAEEGPEIPLALLVGELGAERIQPLVHPAVVGGHRLGVGE